MKKRILIILLFIFLFPVMLFGQNKIIGKVSDLATGKPLSGVDVVVVELQKGTITNDNGEYTLNNIPAGNFTIQYSYIGYKTIVKYAGIKKGTNAINVLLEKTSIEIGQVVVIGNNVTTNENVPYKVETISQKELRDDGLPTLTRSLSLLPGVTEFTNGLAISKPVIRGLYGYRISMLVSGLRFDNQEWQNEHGMGLDEIGFENVEVIEGPAALLYGSEVLGGVVNFIDEKNAPVGHTVGSANLRMFSNTLGADANVGLKGSTEKLSWQIHLGGHSHADYLDGKNQRVPNTRFAGFTGKGSLSYNYSIGTSSLDYTFSHQIDGIVEANELNNPKEKAEDHFEREFEGPHHVIDYHIVSLKNNYYAGNSRFKVNLGYQNNHRVEEEGMDDPIPSGGEGEIDVILQTLSYDVDWIYQLSDFTELTAGSQGWYQKYKNDGGRILIPDAHVREFSFFAYLQQTFGNLILEGGGRYDTKNVNSVEMGEKESLGYLQPTDNSYNTFNFALGATYHFNENLSLKLNAASGYRAPNLAELTSNGIHEGTTRYEIGNPGMESENNIQGDIGVIFQTQIMKLQVSYFNNRVNNYIYLLPTSQNYKGYQINLFTQADATLQGGEASIDLKPIKWFDFNTTYSSVIGKVNDGPYLPWMPQDKIIATAKFNLNDMAWIKNPNITVRTRNYLKQTRPAAFESETAGYTLVDIGMGGRITVASADLDVALNVTNLLGKQYINHLSLLRDLGVHDVGRNISLSVFYPFQLK